MPQAWWKSVNPGTEKAILSLLILAAALKWDANKQSALKFHWFYKRSKMWGTRIS
jgi:hypothetical protein